MVPPERERLNSLFDSLEDWEAQLKGEFEGANKDEIEKAINSAKSLRPSSTNDLDGPVI